MDIEKHTVGLLMLPETQLLDLAGPCDVFSTANQLLELTNGNSNKYYNIVLISASENKTITTSSGIKIQCDYTLKSIDLKIDTLLLTGSSLNLNSEYDPYLLHWLKGTYPSLLRIGSICIGLFLLAKTGLINNKRVTTHWKYANLFSQKYPNINLQYDHIYLKDGNIYTSGGITSGIDLALALTEEDLGREMAANISRHLVVNLKRPHSQTLYASLLPNDLEMSPLVKKTKSYILKNIAKGQTTVKDISAYFNMSERNFSRVFRKEAEISPGYFNDRVRIEHAKHLLECTDYLISEIAIKSGFLSDNVFRKAFHKYTNITPLQYRNYYQSSTVNN